MEAGKAQWAAAQAHLEELRAADPTTYRTLNDSEFANLHQQTDGRADSSQATSTTDQDLS